MLWPAMMPLIDEMLTMEPPEPVAFTVLAINGTASLQPRNTPSRSMACTWRHSSSVMSSRSLVRPMPALLTRMCSPPNAFSVCASVFAQPSSLVTSCASAMAEPLCVSLMDAHESCGRMQRIRRHVHRLFGHAQRIGGQLGDLVCPTLRGGKRFAIGRDLIGKAPCERLSGFYLLAEDDELLGARRANQRNQTRHGVPAHIHAQRNFRQAHMGRARHDAKVAGRRQRAAAADAIFLDGADRDLFDLFPRIAEIGADTCHMATFEEAIGLPSRHRRIFQIGARGKRAFAGEDDGLRLKVVGETARRFGEFENELPRQRIASVAAIHRHCRDGALAGDGNEVANFGFIHARLYRPLPGAS